MSGNKDDWNFKGDEEEELEQTIFENARETILFCIDAADYMQELSRGKKGSSNLHRALKCAVDFQKRKVLFSPNDSVGILLFNTKEHYGGVFDVKDHHYLLQPIQQINAPQIKDLMALVEEAEVDSTLLKKKFEPLNHAVPMATVFSCCVSVFRQCAPKTSVKRVFLITNNDKPPNKPHDISVANRTYLDLTDLGVSVVPFFLSNESNPFDLDRFYSGVLSDLYEAGNMEPVPDPILGFDQLLEEMRIRESVKRALFSAPLQFGEDFSIGVKGYGLIIEQKKPVARKYANVGQTMEETEAVTTYFDSEQQTVVTKDQMVYGFKGGDAAPKKGEEEEEEEEDAGQPRPSRKRQNFFTAAEIREFKTFGLEPGIKILGFKDKDTLRFHDNIKHSYFLYPNEQVR
ncbi:ATP-dependent DNA helicase II subunit 1 [Tulasnella sp. 419]|nr:ATP-dependent DNA helicase II subunit 1 [Tulasnella sp. 419]